MSRDQFEHDKQNTICEFYRWIDMLMPNNNKTCRDKKKHICKNKHKLQTQKPNVLLSMNVCDSYRRNGRLNSFNSPILTKLTKIKIKLKQMNKQRKQQSDNNSTWTIRLQYINEHGK